MLYIKIILLIFSILPLITPYFIHNPLIWSDVPDMDIIRVKDTYYMVSTTMFFSPGAPIMKSKDLVSWEICSYAYNILEDDDKHNLLNGDNDYSYGSWAASLRYKNGVFYVFFGSLSIGKSYICKTSDIENGPWEMTRINGYYHDASLLFDDDGRNYLIFGGSGKIEIKEFNSDLTDFVTTESTVLFETGITEGLAGEGAKILKINNYYYIFIIAWPSDLRRIELCYRSKNLLKDYEGKTILNSGVGTYSPGVGQGAIIDTIDGKWYGYVFQDHGAIGRVPVLTPMTWVDDWPIMGVNGSVPVTMNMNMIGSGTQLAINDEFDYNENKLKLEWQWNHNPDNDNWSVIEKKGFLRLKNNNIVNNILFARNTLTIRAEGPKCSGYIKIDTTNMKIGDYAGLTAFQFKYGNVGVYVKDDGSKKIYVAENGGFSSDDISKSYDSILSEVDLKQNEVYLRMDFDFNDVDDGFNSSFDNNKVMFYYSFDENNWYQIGDVFIMQYSLKVFTGYKFGIYSYPTQTKGGYVDVDFFRYKRTAWN